jgi:demethylspheroidene O-methyltransferase
VFATAALRATSGLRATVLDLPHVVDVAKGQIAEDVSDRLSFLAGSFRDEALPRGFDAISLIRVLYDHQDDTVRDLLSKVHAALPPRGRILISEPMSGGTAPNRPGDVYFAVYTMAMQTGRVRSQDRIADLCLDAGFETVKKVASPRPFVTSCVTAVKPI